jgi:hypothetical protein
MTLSRDQAQVSLSLGRSITIGAALAWALAAGAAAFAAAAEVCRHVVKLRYECLAKFVGLLGPAETRFHRQNGITLRGPGERDETCLHGRRSAAGM